MMISAYGCIHVLVSRTAESLCFMRCGACEVLLVLYMHGEALLHHQISTLLGFPFELCAVLL